MHDMSKSGTSGDEDSKYKQLRSWYLARLRKFALEQHERNLTPAALIQADRALIERLLLGSDVSQNSKSLFVPGTEANNKLVIVYVSTLAVLFLLLLNSMQGNLSEACIAFWNLSLGALLFQVNIAQLFAKISWLSLAVPFAVFVLPTLMLMLRQIKAARLASNRYFWLPQASIILIPLLSFVSLVFASNNPDLAELPNSHFAQAAFSVFAWISLLALLLGLAVEKMFVNPQAVFSQKLRSVSAEKTSAGAELPALLDEIILQREELLSREILIVDASENLLLVLNEEQRILACNWSIQAMLGFLPIEVERKQFSDFVLPEELAAVQQNFALCKSSKQAQSFDCRMLTNHKQAVDLRWTVEYSSTQNCFFAAGQNVSNEKTLERAKREFVSMLGHDIKTPLTGSLLSVQFVRGGMLESNPTKADIQLSHVEASLKRLIVLLEELLEFEQLAAGKMKLTRAPVDLAKLAENAIAEVNESALRKSIKISSENTDCELSVDSGKLMRVIVNLLSNAIKFSPQDSKILVSILKPSADTVEFRVKDEGPGIAPEYQKLIFERYERLATTSKEEGSGLGLAIAKAIVESHGGSIGVTSVPGKGASFWFRLPVVVA